MLASRVPVSSVKIDELVFVLPNRNRSAQLPESIEVFLEERLQAFLLAHGALPPPALIEAVREDVLGFCRGERLRDDMTMMVVAR